MNKRARRKPKGMSDRVSNTLSGIHRRPLGLYTLLSLAVLCGLPGLHIALSTLLSLLGVTVFSTVVNTAFAYLYAWTLGGLSISLILYAWLKAKPLGVTMALAAAILWVLGLGRHAASLSLILYLTPLAGASALFWGALRLGSDVLLPVTDETGRENVFSFLKAYILGTNRPAFVVDPSAGEKRVQKRVSGDQFSKTTDSPGIVVTGCDHAVALSDGFRFKGAHGPGVVFTGRGDRVVQAFDLRPQVRTFRMTGLTKDGIQVTVDAVVSFRLDAGRREPTLGQGLPFNRSAAFKALRAQRVEQRTVTYVPGTAEQAEWDDLPRIRGEHILRNIVSKLAFDELYDPHQPRGRPPRRKIAEDFDDQLTADLEPLGIQLISARLGNLEPDDPEVYLRRARNWEAEWTRRITLKQAQGQAERLQILERARADTRADLILDLGRQLEELTEASADLDAETVLNRFLVLVEQLTTQPQLRQVLPRRTMELLNDVRKAVGE